MNNVLIHAPHRFEVVSFLIANLYIKDIWSLVRAVHERTASGQVTNGCNRIDQGWVYVTGQHCHSNLHSSVTVASNGADEEVVSWLEIG